MIGRNCNVRIKGVDGLERHFNGVLTEANYTGGQYGLFGYQFVLRPWLHLLSRTSDCRIFSNMKPNKIINKVFSDRGFNDFRENLKESIRRSNTSVQYRETDLNFVCRLMEKFGIYYYFEHTESKHTMVLCDAPSCHEQDPGPATGAAAAGHGREPARPAAVRHLVDRARACRPARTRSTSYCCEKPTADLLGKSDKHGNYEHSHAGDLRLRPGASTTRADGEKCAKVRVEAVQALDDHRIAIGAAPSLFPGGKLTHGRIAAGVRQQGICRAALHAFLRRSDLYFRRAARRSPMPALMS